MPITLRDKQELAQIFSDHGKKYSGVMQDYFALLYLRRKFKCEPEEIANQVAFGGNDYGLDAFYIDRPSCNLYLYQFKWSEDHNLFKESMERLTKDGLERVFGNPLADPTKNQFLNFLKAELAERPKIDRIFIHMVFMGDVDKAVNSKGLDLRREDLENKRHLVQDFFKNPEAELRVEFISHLRPPPPSAILDSGTVKLDRPSLVETQDGIKMLVGFVPLMDLYRISDRLQRRFLSRNIRFGLSPDNPPNRKIRQALADAVIKQTVPTDVFPFNHNGVALAAKKVALDHGTAVLTVPRLLNGAQTITSVKVFIEENQKHLANETNRKKLEEIHVLAKIIEHDPNSDFVTNVTICNNRQNPVEPWDLRANDRIQCDLEDKFREEAKVFYSRQENAFENMSEDELESMGVDGSNDIRIRPLAQTFLAAQGEIGRMSKLPDVFEVQKQYEETFRESYLDADARKIILAYKVYLARKSPMEHLDELVAQKWSTPLRRGRNLVWALMIQAVFNDPNLKQNLDNYAEALSVSWDFRDYLRKLAAGKVRKILAYIFNHRDFADRLQREKYDFLRNKETFQRCMDYAFREFDWKKMSF